MTGILNPMDVVSHAPLLLIQVPVQSGFERWVDVIADVATIVIAVAIIVVGFVAIYGALKVRGMIRRIRGDFDPALRNLTAVSEQAKAISGTLRKNVEELGGTVSQTNDKVRRATEAVEARLGELNALVGVMQGEAEELFVRTASAVRGVQVGAGALAGRHRRGADEDYDREMDGLLDDDDTMDAGYDAVSIRVTPPRRTGRDILDD
jgi:methyl-accepting chemotaxis protein